MGRLTAAAVRALTRPGRYGDGGTLHLHIAPRGSKSWIQRITIGARRCDIGLGSVDIVSLAKARAAALANRVAIAEGRDPLAEKRRAKVPTFRETAVLTFEANRPRWRSRKTADNWIGQMERHAYPVLAQMRVDKIGREAVLRVLTPLWTAHPAIARQMRARIRSVLSFAQAHGYVDQNAAGDGISGALPAMPATRSHHKALPYRAVAGALATVAAAPRASIAARACFRFMVLTGARSGEARLATWDEIDRDAREWRVPARRMKMNREHRVPLSDAALAALADVWPLRDASGLVFPSPIRPGRPLADCTLVRLLRDSGVAAVPHGFRSSFRDWAAERTSVPHAVCEAALAHLVGSDVERSYARSDLFDQRRALMDRWAAFVTEADAGKVVRIG